MRGLKPVPVPCTTNAILRVPCVDAKVTHTLLDAQKQMRKTVRNGMYEARVRMRISLRDHQKYQQNPRVITIMPVGARSGFYAGLYLYFVMLS